MSITRTALRQFASELYDEIYADDIGERSIARDEAMKCVHRKAMALEAAMIVLETVHDLEAQKMRAATMRAFDNLITTIREAAE